MLEENFMNKLDEYIENKVKDRFRKFIDFFQVVDYNEDTGKITLRKIYEKADEIVEIFDTGTGFGDKKQINTGYAPGDIVVLMDFKGSKIVVGSLFNDFFNEKDRKLIPKKNETIIKSNAGFKLLNKDGYGIVCDEEGNITIRGKTVNHTQTKETLNYIE